jgi:rubrerythrin
MPSERERLIGLLDAFQIAERAGAEALGRWIAACDDPRLRGGLKVIRSRDRRHARLAEARLRALGGTPVAPVGRELAALCGVVADPGVSNRSKLALLVARFPTPDHAALAEVVREIGEDAETRALLETIGDDERASLRWLLRMRDTLEREGA